MLLMLMPRGASSMERLRVNIFIPPFEAQYDERPGNGRSSCTDEMLTTVPRTSASFNFFNEHLCTEEWRTEVHIQYFIVIFWGDIPEICVNLNARIVHEDVYCPECFPRLVDEILDVLVVGDVPLDRDCT